MFAILENEKWKLVTKPNWYNDNGNLLSNEELINHGYFPVVVEEINKDKVLIGFELIKEESVVKKIWKYKETVNQTNSILGNLNLENNEVLNIPPVSARPDDNINGEVKNINKKLRI